MSNVVDIGGVEYPAAFVAIMEKSFAWEGGWVNDPADRGGQTNLGVTQSTYSAFLGRPATDADMYALTREKALAVYFKLFWQGFNIPAYPNFLRLEVWNSFTGSTFLGNKAVQALQRLLGLNADGVVGPKTLEAFRACEGWDEKAKWVLNNQLVKAIILELIRICKRDPSQLRFIEGWFNRYSEFFDTVNDPTTQPV